LGCSLNPAIFREYDIRGVVETDLAPEQVWILGLALGTYFRRHGARSLVVGRDCRLSSPDIATLLQEALCASGCEVVDLGVCPTPVLYFAHHHYQSDGGVMVTASHNPPEFNGFKICLKGDTISGPEIKRLWEIAATGDFIRGDGRKAREDIIPHYLDYLSQHFRLKRPLRVAVDGGHGTAGPVALNLLERLGCEVWPLYCDMDGRFPAHLPDPTVPAHLTELQQVVQTQGLDLGVAYDGDGDRLGVVGPQGEIIWGDQLLIIFARDILSRHPGAVIMGEVKCSQRLYEEIARLGGRPLMWKTGHSLIKQKMKEVGALLAGEMSGHLFFADRYFGYDDAIYATGRLLEILAATDRTITELLNDIPATVVTPEIRMPCPDDTKFEVIANLRERLAGKYPFVAIDGLRLQFPEGWGLIRASNTQPALVLRFEADTPEHLQEIQDRVCGWLQEELSAQGVSYEFGSV